MTQKNESAMISVKQAAALLMVTDRWIRELVSKGYIPKPESGQIPLVGAVQGYIAHLKDEERKSTKTAEARRVQEARATEIELRNARQAGQLMEVSTFERIVAEAFGAFRSELDGLPAGVTRDVILRASIQNYVEGMCGRIRTRIVKMSDALRTEAQQIAGKK